MRKKIFVMFIVAMMVVSTIAFFIVPNEEQGKLNSISDALNLTPSGVTFALYLDVQEMRGTPLGELLTRAGAVQSYELYNAEITRMCTIMFEDGTWVEFHQTATRPRFRYTATIDHRGYEILVREGGVGNVKRVIGIIEGDATPARDELKILEKVHEPVEFEKVSIEDFAEVFYMSIHRLKDGKYQRTTIYQNPSETKATNLTQLAETAPSRGLVYNIRQEEEYLIVTVAGDFRTVINEPS
ncbi:MAG: hypothetical protein QMD78_04235 [Methanocellales archaeon]|nr:hypothetical protein [Methanocellales archaeon]